MADIQDHRSHALLLGSGREPVLSLARAAAAMAGQALVVRPSLAGDAGAEEPRPGAIVLDLADEGALDRASQVRARFSLAAVPMIGVAPAVGDLAFEEVLSVGMDECCPADEQALGRLLRAVEGAQLGKVDRRGKTVVVADADRNARLLAGRVFHTAGYDVEFALDADETLARAGEPAVLAVICAAALALPEAAGEPLWRAAVGLGSHAVWVVSTPPKRIAEVLGRIAADDLGRVDVHDAFSVPDNLLFVTNELLAGELRDARRSPRVLYGTSVRFRPAGAERAAEQIGYSYNVSGGGLYVRTLAPPERESELWLELLPPRSDRRVHLEGAVRWARPYVPGSGATVPAGFGLEITAATPSDRQRYEQGCRAFVAERVELRATSLPPRK